MATVLYKPGSTKIIRGIECDLQKFENGSVEHALSNGWSYSPAECYEIKEEIPEEPDTEVIEHVEMSDDEIRQEAKAKGIRNWHNKKITRLKVEIKEWQPEI